MRVLFTTWAWPSHLYALVPMAWAFRSAGHEVLVATQPGLREEVVRTGLQGTSVGYDVDGVGMVRGYILPSETDGPPISSAPHASRGPRALQMFLAHAESMTEDLVGLAKEWRPDLVVFEPTALAGPIAAASVGVPAVRLLYGTDLMLRAQQMLPDAIAPLAARFGVAGPDPFGAVTVDPTPTGLQVPGEYRRLPLRYVPFNGPGERPEPLPERRDRPRVLVTWGHTMARLDPRRFLAGEVARALAGLDVEVVLAVAGEQRTLLGPLAPGVRIEVDAPLHQLLPECDLVVAHGGAGTVLTSLLHGVPMLLIPQLPDHAGHAARVLAAGAGEVLTRDEATAERIRSEVSRLVADGPERAAAAALRAEMLAQPTPSEVAAQLEELAAGH
ncbi:nucleotide disphospho-sugar-binding domain-containing protein [Streptomyces sp. NPDC006733]|uniref:nucleotide disphospho-sugar-binding domain-containing protein n=1 Tax=Streptomyces sp. NPDC006733 TaxID=3155460 RepID=UPI0033E828C9